MKKSERNLMNKKIKVAILFGGQSPEHSISIISAINIMNSFDSKIFEVYPYAITTTNRWLSLNSTKKKLTTNKKINHHTQILDSHLNEYLDTKDQITNELSSLDIVFPCIHGKYGEDGQIQKFLESINIKYVGSNSAASTICYDKSLTKAYFKKLKIPQTKYLAMDVSEIKKLELNITNELSFPCYVKPARGGSSLGIIRVENMMEIYKNIHHVTKIDTKIIIEQEVTGKEIECSVIGNGKIEFAKIGEIKNPNKFYDFEHKYANKEVELLIPAKIKNNNKEKIFIYAKNAYEAMKLSGLARIDFFIDESNNNIFINEINTMPGFTQKSLFPLAWNKSGLNTKDLLTKLINYGME
ncbi:MAG: D-alanine-D-alanine ligase [Chloroflexi bacterium]|jgi:D-alanine-D-alanine ligase|nr:MAG: D-alanine-D-alanine ligase [Chloroflexota bacterium]